MAKFHRRIALLIGVCLLHAQIGAAATYVTEAKVSVDRCASAWFIKRFVDSGAEFVFIAPNAERPAGTTFGFFGAEYFNRASDCTFTALVKRNGKGDVEALRKINELANDAVNWRYGPQFLGRQLLEHIADLRKVCTSDADVFQKVFPTFDLLFLLYGGNSGECLPAQRSNVDAVEIILLSELLDESECNRIKADVAGVANSTPDAVWRGLGLGDRLPAASGETATFESLQEVLTKRAAQNADGSLSWLSSVTPPGLQRERIEGLMKWGEQRATGPDARHQAFRFQMTTFKRLLAPTGK
jgi:hypothetical protein